MLCTLTNDCVFPFQLICLLDEDGKYKYSHLGKFVLTVLLLPHGNADPEIGFSVSKKLLERHSQKSFGVHSNCERFSYSKWWLGIH